MMMEICFQFCKLIRFNWKIANNERNMLVLHTHSIAPSNLILNVYIKLRLVFVAFYRNNLSALKRREEISKWAHSTNVW